MAIALFACFLGGGVAGWLLRDKGPPIPIVQLGAPDGVAPSRPVSTTGEATWSAAPALDNLRHREMRLPIDGADVEKLKGMFSEARGGSRPHEAVDILAPRATPIHAAEDGTIAKLFDSRQGGHTIYQFDPEQRFCYYYAHLDRYAPGLHEDQRVTRGDVIGFVGTSGNAPADTPHLHFAIFELGPEKRWWQGRPIDPYLVFHR